MAAPKRRIPHPNAGFPETAPANDYTCQTLNAAGRSQSLFITRA